MATSKAVLIPDHPFLFGTMMGGPGAFLALGSLALPLALAIVLHLLSPRGSRESLSDRLGHSSQGSLVLLLVIMMLLGVVSDRSGRRPVVLLAGGPGAGDRRAAGPGAARFSLAGLRPGDPACLPASAWG